jgi:hypothetical protein
MINCIYSPNLLPDMVDSFSGLVGSTPASEKYFSHGFVRSVVGIPYIVWNLSHDAL